jgi:flagellar protein FliS
MNTYTAQPNAYRQSAVLTATPERLIVMLYDGMHRFLSQAAAAMRAQNIPATHTRLRQAESILAHLQGTLDLSQGEIAQNLLSIYLFCRRHLNEARIELDPVKVDEVDGLLMTLRDAWDQIC